MRVTRSLILPVLTGGLVLAALFWPATDRPVRAQQPTASTVRGTVDAAVTVRQETQQQLDGWAAERAALQARLRGAEADVAYLSERRQAARERVAALEERVAELTRRHAEAARLEVGLQDTLWVMLRQLERWVAGDLPFLPRERATRLASLREEVARPDVPLAEKLRRLLEALQIETQYGATTEVYPDRIAVDGDSLYVDVFRLGRLSLFWRTADGARIGEYDRARGAWVELPGRHRRAITQAIEMAERRRATELIELPLGRIAP